MNIPDIDVGFKVQKKSKDHKREMSINITQEALDIGKVPPEYIAQLIANSGHNLSQVDPNLSPRTKEMADISTIIRKSFIKSG